MFLSFVEVFLIVFYVTWDGNWLDEATLISDWFTFQINEHNVGGKYEPDDEVQLFGLRAETSADEASRGTKLVDCCDRRAVRLIVGAMIDLPEPLVYTFWVLWVVAHWWETMTLNIPVEKVFIAYYVPQYHWRPLFYEGIGIFQLSILSQCKNWNMKKTFFPKTSLVAKSLRSQFHSKGI